MTHGRSLVGMVAAAALAGTAYGGGGGLERSWRYFDSGSFHDESRWVDGSELGIPTIDDTAIWDVGWSITIGFEEDTATDRMIIRSGIVDFDLSGFDYTLMNDLISTPGIVIGDTPEHQPQLHVTGGALEAMIIDVASEIGSFGALVVDDASGSIDGDLRLHIGALGNALFELSDGATATAGSTVLGLGSSSTGFATIEDATLSCANDLTVGKSGFAMLEALDGATLTSGSGKVAQQVGSFAIATIDGPGTTWTIDGILDIGFVGHGVLDITDGATVTNSVFATLGASAAGTFPDVEHGSGEVTVDGAGSTWVVNGDVWIGIISTSLVSASRGGRVNVDGDLYLGDSFPESTLRVELGSAGDYTGAAAFEVTGLMDEFEVAIELVDGFEPQSGDSFAIATADLGMVPPIYALPELGGGLAWAVEQFADSSTLVVVADVPADINGDGAVDVDDLIALLAAWGPCGKGDPCDADIDGDGDVGVNDLLIVIASWS